MVKTVHALCLGLCFKNNLENTFQRITTSTKTYGNINMDPTVRNSFYQPPKSLQISFFLFPIMYPRDTVLKLWYRMPPSVLYHALLKAGHRAVLWDLFILSYNCTFTKAQKASVVILDNSIHWCGNLNCPLFWCYILLLLKHPITLWNGTRWSKRLVLNLLMEQNKNTDFVLLVTEVNMFIQIESIMSNK